MIPRDELVVADIARWGIDQTVDVPPGANIGRLVKRLAAENHLIIFGSPRRRWVEVMEAVRAAVVTKGGDITLRFYQPTVTIDVRMRIDSVREDRIVCPSIAEFEKGGATKAHAVKCAVKDGISDILAAGMRAVDQRLQDSYVDFQARGIL